EKTRGRGSIDDPVIESQTKPHRGSRDNLAVSNDGTLGDPANAKNRALWPVNDRGEGLDPEHSHVADGKRSPGHVISTELTLARAIGDVANGLRDLDK